MANKGRQLCPRLAHKVAKRKYSRKLRLNVKEKRMDMPIRKFPFFFLRFLRTFFVKPICFVFFPVFFPFFFSFAHFEPFCCSRCYEKFTGSAAIYGLRGKEHVNCFIMFPEGRVSEIQERQMTTVPDPNIHCVSIEGSFDDCQDIVKAAFADKPFRRETRQGA